MTGILRRLRARIRYRHFDAELERELDMHRGMLEGEALAHGASAEEARYQAARQLGNVTLAREVARGVWIASWLESTWQDVRYGLRGLKANPAFTLPALAVLVITMGLTTSLYAAVESVLFRPWPVPDADRVVVVSEKHHLRDTTVFSTSLAEYRHLRDNARSADLIAMTTEELRLGIAKESRPSEVRLVSGNYFDVLRIPVATGRGLTRADDTRGGGSAVAVISHGLLERQFGGAPIAIGSVLHIENVPFTVVGVAAAGATDAPFTLRPEAWIPLGATSVLMAGDPAIERFFEDPQWFSVQVAGRLAAGVDRQTAEAEIKLLAAQFADAHRVSPPDVAVRSTAFVNQPFADDAIRIFSLLSVAVGLILLLGCANVGNLQLARGVSRRREVGVRLALGATRARLVRQLLVEGLALCVAAAVISLIVAWFFLPLLLERIEPMMGRLVTVDGRTILFAFVLAVPVCLISGTLPALKASRFSIASRAAGGRASHLRASLLGLQVAISIVLLVGAGLLARGVHHAAGSGLGFNPYGVVAVGLGLPPDEYSAADHQQLSRTLVDMADRSGLGPIGGTWFAPFTAYRASREVRLPGGDPVQQSPFTVRHQVTPGYFEVLDIPVVAGRLFGASDPRGDVIVNEALVRALWPGGSAVGRVFLDNERDADSREKRVIGVVADANAQRFDRRTPIYYERADALLSVLIRNDPDAVARLRQMILSLAPTASPEVRDLVLGLHEQLDPSITGTAIAVAVALLALLLAAVGTLGVFSYVVTERTQEIGVRMTLGAGAREIVSMLVARLSWPLAGGLAVGLLAAQGLGRMLGSQLYGISPRDPFAYAAVLLVLAAAAIVATFMPARRALRLDPAVTLRAE